ncbi:hypothetical protein RchiOBHm_Chr1g0331021 [Rosa chinensis]|uniref:Uncharacterized protein n=1 Tax=Rosa chinensis TaxID=74649 RepID=A0A2P6SBE6_ROSCH|nr:hypothetical protein RchiOBHm_Chr1g0331021 [Rosa chinensis]
MVNFYWSIWRNRFSICSDGEVSAGTSVLIEFGSAPMVKFLLEDLEKSGCGILDGSCWAVHCEKKIAGVYTRRGWGVFCGPHHACSEV